MRLQIVCVLHDGTKNLGQWKPSTFYIPSTVDGRNPAITSWYGKSTIIYRVLSMSGDSPDFWTINIPSTLPPIIMEVDKWGPGRCVACLQMGYFPLPWLREEGYHQQQHLQSSNDLKLFQAAKQSCVATNISTKCPQPWGEGTPAHVDESHHQMTDTGCSNIFGTYQDRGMQKYSHFLWKKNMRNLWKSEITMDMDLE